VKRNKLIVILLLLVCFITACGKSDKKFNVTFNFDDGTTTTVVEVYENQMVSKPQAPTRDGYIFIGWYLGEEEFDFSSKITKDIILSAKWSINTSAEIKWKVTFNTDGGEPVDVQNVKDGEKIDTNKVNTSKDGYKFLGWYSGDEKFDFETIITKDITLTAKWEKVQTEDTRTKYTVTFDSKEGSKVPAQSVVENGTAKKPTDPKRTGYTFKGWYLGETAYNFSTKVTKNITLTAKWEEKAPTYGYKWVKVEGSTAGESILYLTKNNVVIAGKADVTSQSGKVVTITVPISGLKLVESEFPSISNIREN